MMARCSPAKLACAIGPECRDVGISVSALPSGADERLHVIQIVLERAAPGGRVSIFYVLHMLTGFMVLENAAEKEAFRSKEKDPDKDEDLVADPPLDIESCRRGFKHLKKVSVQLQA